MNRIPVDKVLVSSTVYDQNDFRRILVRELRSLEFDAYTFDMAPIPATTDSQSSDLCLDLVDDADCVIGIIGPRQGNPYQGTRRLALFEQISAPKKLSITQAEILYSMELKKPTIKLLREGVWDARNFAKKNPKAENSLAPDIIAFLDFINQRETNNWIHIDVTTIDQAIAIISSAIIPKKRLALLANAMTGPGWNGKNFFSNREVKIVNSMTDAYTAILELRRLDSHSNIAINRLQWLVKLLAPDEMSADEIEFLVNYTIEYSHAKSEADLQKKNLRENRAIALLERLRFGDNSVFGGYRQSQEGGKPQVLTWPANAHNWSPHGRVEFMLYSLEMEQHVPVDLRRMMEFSSGTKSEKGLGFEAHYSRKPVTVGCESACEVRLRKDLSTRGINLCEEMKSLIYIAQIGTRFCLVAVHGEGDKHVNEGAVIARVEAEFGIESLTGVIPHELSAYLRRIACPTPRDTIYSGRKLLFDGAQQIISLYSSAINPVSIFKSVEFKYGFIDSVCSSLDGFDVLMLWDDRILKACQCYNNAGSPTFGVRFNPKAMFEHVQMNVENLMIRMKHIGRFTVGSGDFFLDPRRAD